MIAVYLVAALAALAACIAALVLSGYLPPPIRHVCVFVDE